MGASVSSVSYGAQINQISTSLTCHFIDASDTFNLTLTTTSPLNGQTFPHAAIAGSITLPDNFKRYGESIGGDITVNATIALGLTNATTSSILIQQTIVQPAGDAVLPITAADYEVTIDGISRLSLDQVNLTVLYKSFVVPFDVTCDRSNALIATVVPGVGATNFKGSAQFPSLQSGQKGTAVSIPWGACGPDHNDASFYELTLQGVTPLSLRSGQDFSITGVDMNLVGPGGTIQVFTTYYGIVSDTVTVNVELGEQSTNRRTPLNPVSPGLGAIVSNAQPATIDISRDFTTTDSSVSSPLSASKDVPANSAADVVWTIPAFSTLSLGPFTPDSGIFGLNVANMQGIVYGYIKDPSYGPDVYTDFMCNAPSFMEVFSAPISA